MLACLDQTRRHQPEPAPLLYAAHPVSAAPRDGVIVGDAVPDVAAGWFGMTSAVFGVLDNART